MRGVAVVGLFAAAVAPVKVEASVDPVGPFSGAHVEGFEQATGTWAPSIENLFGGIARVVAIGGPGLNISGGFFGQADLYPRSGAVFLGAGSAYEWLFSTPVRRFGGYFANIGATPGALATFYDSNGSVLAADVPMGVRNDPRESVAWTWNGWESIGAPIARVRVVSNDAGYPGVSMDDMVADTTASGVAPIPAFEDGVSEGFETSSGFNLPVIPNLLGGRARLEALGGEGLTIASAFYGQSVLRPRSGGRMMAARSDYEWVFDPPVTAFGGYFATIGIVPGATATFYDREGHTISENVPVTARVDPIEDVEWTWNGWQTMERPIARVRITALDPGYRTVSLDDMRARFACTADYNGDGQVDFFDYLDFVAAFAADDPSADFNGDGQVDFFDYLDFVAAFAEGCE